LVAKLEQFKSEPDVARISCGRARCRRSARSSSAALAATLEYLAQHGSSFTGELAAKLVAGVRRRAVCGPRRILRPTARSNVRPWSGSTVARVVSAPPPSSGGVGLIEALNVLAQFDLHAPRGRAQAPDHRGDAPRTPRSGRVPGRSGLCRRSGGAPDQYRLRGGTGGLDPHRSQHAQQPLPGIGAGANAGPQTTHFSVLDRDGNRVAATITLNLRFGSGP
jgi:gamma-glutamyltranspeptidase/glutathione hydrolase